MKLVSGFIIKYEFLVSDANRYRVGGCRPPDRTKDDGQSWNTHRPDRDSTFGISPCVEEGRRVSLGASRQTNPLQVASLLATNTASYVMFCSLCCLKSS